MEELPRWVTITILFIILVVVLIGDIHVIKHWMSGDKKKNKKIDR